MQASKRKSGHDWVERLFEGGSETDWRYPTVVVDFPVEFTDRVGCFQRRLMPLLLVRTEGGVVIPRETTGWVQERLVATSLEKLHADVATIGRLTAYQILSGNPILEGPRDCDLLVDSYLLLRTAGPTQIGLRPFPLWNPVSPDHIRVELAAIDSFLQHCISLTGPLSFLSGALGHANGIFGASQPKRVNGNNFPHLDESWERYQRLSKLSPALSPHLKKLARAYPQVLPDSGKIMTGEEADRIIECTDNIGYRSLFAGMKGVGRRTSEYLHQYRCDYVPSELVHHFLGFDNGDPLLLFCHPSKSTFLGSIEDLSPLRKRTRQTFLRNDYNGLEPRHLSDDKSYRVGWKGMVFYHRKLITIPPWIDHRCIEILQEGREEMKAALGRSGNQSRHPYLFVYCSNRDALGEPVKISQVERAFERAARKAGLWGQEGIHLHGFRHHYVWFVRNELEFKRTEIKIAMGHSSEASQDDYGGMLKSMFNRVSQKQAARHAA